MKTDMSSMTTALILEKPSYFTLKNEPPFVFLLVTQKTNITHDYLSFLEWTLVQDILWPPGPMGRSGPGDIMWMASSVMGYIQTRIYPPWYISHRLYKS
jgi:hypothetical protein